MPTRHLLGAALASAFGLCACTNVPAPPPPLVVAPEPPPAATSSAPAPDASGASSTPIAVEPTAPPSAGRDDAPGKRERVPTAVVLFGTRGLSEGETLRFVPVVCSIQGTLATGKKCGEAMPARARVRTTRAAPSVPAILTVARSTKDFRDENGGHVYRAPTGPACCMYNTCLGETIPYAASPAPRESPTAILAVWPETADVDLQPRPRGVDRAEIPDSPWTNRASARLEQGVAVRGRRLISGRGDIRCRSCAEIWTDGGSGWARVEPAAMGADGYDVLATTDVDGDGRPEAIVYEAWRNDYGLLVLGGDWSKAAYRYSCGNI
jgi:hypothetical protein